MNNDRFTVCTDCGGQTPITQTHKCVDGGERASQRIAAELLDQIIGEVTHENRAATGTGILWLYRVAYRVRSRMNGLEKYKDRAELARLACALGGEPYR